MPALRTLIARGYSLFHRRRLRKPSPRGTSVVPGLWCKLFPPAMSATLSMTLLRAFSSNLLASLCLLCPARAAINSFNVSPPVIVAGRSATLSWSVTGATGLTLNGQDVTGLDSLAVTPAVSTVYTLTATGEGAPATASVELVVRPPVRINEVMAENTRTLKDENGEWHDWIELFNAGPAAVDIAGWRLTDDPANSGKWVFQAGTVLPPGGYRLVFASGNDRRDPTAPLHANFRLDNDGEYLALVAPDGQIASQFAPRFPALAPDASYGHGSVPDKTETTIIPGGATLKYQIPTGAVDEAWRGTAFDDSGWATGSFGAGYSTEAQGAVTSLSLPAGLAGNQSYSGALGMDFNVLQATDITELGCFDDSGNGIATGVTLTVQIWARNQNGTPGTTADDTGQSMLTSLTFTRADPGTPTGAYRFKPLATPRTLPPGAYTIVAHGYSGAERNGNGVANVVNTGGGLIGFVGTSRYGTAGQFPGTPDGGPATRYGAGTFSFRRSGPVFHTDLSAMNGQNPGVLVRLPFTGPDAAAWQNLSAEHRIRRRLRRVDQWP